MDRWGEEAIRERDAEIERLQRELDARTAAANIRMYDQNAEIARLHAEIKKMRSLPRSGDVEEIERLRSALRAIKEMGEGKISGLPLGAWKIAHDALEQKGDGK